MFPREKRCTGWEGNKLWGKLKWRNHKAEPECRSDFAGGHGHEIRKLAEGINQVSWRDW